MATMFAFICKQRDYGINGAYEVPVLTRPILTEKERPGNHRFKFNKHTEQLTPAHNESLSVAMRVSNPDCSPLESTAETRPKLQPAFLGLSAMISQYFV